MTKFQKLKDVATGLPARKETLSSIKDGTSKVTDLFDGSMLSS